MKTTSILFFLLIIGIHNIVAQEQKTPLSKGHIITNLGVKSTTELNAVFVEIQSKQTIDLVVYKDKRGAIVLKEIPQNNKITAHSLKPGFYLLCAYHNGVQVKKGILKKMSS